MVLLDVIKPVEYIWPLYEESAVIWILKYDKYKFNGADGGTWTHTAIGYHPLKMARLPIPPHPPIKLNLL